MLAQAGFLHLSSFVTVTLSDPIELHYPPGITLIGVPLCCCVGCPSVAISDQCRP